MKLVLLPVLDGTGELFERFIGALDDDIEAVVVRYPNTEVLGYAELENLVRAALPADAPFFVLGESFSGPIAIALAAEAPARLKGLVLCCTFARNPYPHFGALRWMVDFMPHAQATMSFMNHLLLGRFSTPPLRAAIADALSRVKPDVMRARVRAVLSCDVSDRLGQVGVPTLYLQAAHDPVVPTAAWKWIQRHRPEARMVEFDAPHFLLQSLPEETARVVCAFIRETQHKGSAAS